MASEGGSLSNLVQVYKFVVEDVIKNVKEDFLNEGVEPDVLDQLKELWLRKEDLTGAVDRPRKPQLDPLPPPVPPPPPPPSQHSEEHVRPPPPALIHQPLAPTTHRSTGTQAQSQQEIFSVIQVAPPRNLPTPTLPSPSHITHITHVTHGTAQPSPTQAQILLPSRAGYPVTMATVSSINQGEPVDQGASGRVGGVVSTQTPPTTSVGVGGGHQLGGTGRAAALPNLMPQLVVNPSVGGVAGLQNQHVLVPVQTSQGTVMLPLTTVLAMQQVAAASLQNQQNQSNQSGGSGAHNLQQTDGLPPIVAGLESHQIQSKDEEQRQGGRRRRREGEERRERREEGGREREEEGGRERGEEGGVERGEEERRKTKTKSMTNTGEKRKRTRESVKKNSQNSRKLCSSSIEEPFAQYSEERKATPINTDSFEGLPQSALFRRLLREQTRRRRRGSRGGIPVEVIVQLDGGAGESGKGGGGGGGGEGGGSSSEEDSDRYDDSSEEEEVDLVDEDPLGSEDDENDSDSGDKGDFDTEDTVACQWEKVYRVKAKWKFLLKDGIMRMKGFEYVFHKASGEADW